MPLHSDLPKAYAKAIFHTWKTETKCDISDYPFAPSYLRDTISFLKEVRIIARLTTEDVDDTGKMKAAFRGK